MISGRARAGPGPKSMPRDHPRSGRIRALRESIPYGAVMVNGKLSS